MDEDISYYLSPEDYRTELSKLLKCIEDSYTNSKCNELKKCEQVFIKKIGEISKTFKETGNICYEKVYKSAMNKYYELINQKINYSALPLIDKIL